MPPHESLRLSTGTVSKGKFIETMKYQLADGSTTSGERYVLHQMQIGDHVAKDVIVGVGGANSSLLLGQSFFEKFGAWSLDNNDNILILSDK
jgi:predicted aspartyl protease